MAASDAIIVVSWIRLKSQQQHNGALWTISRFKRHYKDDDDVEAFVFLSGGAAVVHSSFAWTFLFGRVAHPFSRRTTRELVRCYITKVIGLLDGGNTNSSSRRVGQEKTQQQYIYRSCHSFPAVVRVIIKFLPVTSHSSYRFPMYPCAIHPQKKKKEAKYS